MQFLIKGTVSNKSFCVKSGWRGWGLMSMKIITSKGIEDGPN